MTLKIFERPGARGGKVEPGTERGECERKRGRFCRLKRAGLVLAALVGIGGVAVAIIDLRVEAMGRPIYLKATDVPEGKVALLLGTSKKAYGRPNLFFQRRIDAAVELYESRHLRAILVSGDHSRPGYNEPQDMKDALVARGVPEGRVFLDFAGYSTLDSVLRARRVFGLHDFVVISQGFHLERALYIARANGIAAVGFEAQGVYGPLALRVHLREYLARVKAFAQAELLGSGPRHIGEDPYGLGS